MNDRLNDAVHSTLIFSLFCYSSARTAHRILVTHIKKKKEILRKHKGAVNDRLNDAVHSTLIFSLFCYSSARTAHRILVERARLLRLHSSAEGRMTSVEMSL